MLLRSFIIMSLLLTGGLFACDDDPKENKTTPGCGDGILQEGEVCDGAELAGASCETLGYGGGTLACAADCGALDASGCVSTCGNGVLETGETCDDDNTAAGDGCAADCTVEAGWNCTEDTPSVCTSVCGDDLVVGAEACDGAALGGQTCELLGYYGGELACLADCSGFDLAPCEAAGTCGDGIHQGASGEPCEGEFLGEETCESQGYYPGTLACTDACAFDFTGCDGRCGDDVIQSEFGENCDGAELEGTTCADNGYYGGQLACLPDCSDVDWSPCEPFGWCGDGIIQGTHGELCDITELGGLTCESQGFDLGGPLQCQWWCTEFDTRACASTPSMVAVPAGTFQRDATATNLSTISAFLMSREEVSRALFAVVMGVDPGTSGNSNDKRAPVETVSWYHAVAFCNKLSLLEGLEPVYTVAGVDFSTLTFAEVPTVIDATWDAVTADWNATGYRLPTEMEWRWAAMGADLAAPGEINHTGYNKAFAGSTGANVAADYAWYNANANGETHDAAMKLPNELGIHDLSGNVYEWTWDWSGGFPAGTLVDYRGPATGTARTRCGSYWGFDVSLLVLNQRHNGFPNHQHAGFGFRIARRP